MRKITFKVDEEKTREVIAYIAKHVKRLTRHKVCKIMYFADKMHLGEYGRFITGDTYIAMEYGPVPSYAYDYIKSVRQEDTQEAIIVEGRDIEARREPDISLLSESDILCLDVAIKKYGKMEFDELTNTSHEDAAWHETPENGEMTVEDIARMLPDSEKLIAHLRNPHP